MTEGFEGLNLLTDKYKCTSSDPFFTSAPHYAYSIILAGHCSYVSAIAYNNLLHTTGPCQRTHFSGLLVLADFFIIIPF